MVDKLVWGLAGSALIALASLGLAACGGGGATNTVANAEHGTQLGPGGTAPPSVTQTNSWVASWTAAPTGPASLTDSAVLLPLITFSNQTVRMVVRSSLGGGAVRIRLSNEIGDDPAPVRVGSAHVGIHDQGGGTVAGSDRAITFNGQGEVTIPAKGYVYSDPIDLDVPALTDLAVSVYLPGIAVAQSFHPVTRQTNYVAPGDQTGSRTLPLLTRTTDFWFLLSAVDVRATAPKAAALVAFGDSISDGYGDSSIRVQAPTPWPSWPSRLGERLQAAGPLKNLAVVNAGISGNRILNDAKAETPPSVNGIISQATAGPGGLSRFKRNVLDQSGVSCVVILQGINDIGQGPSRQQEVTPEQLIAGQQQLIAAARNAGLKVIGATLTPFEGADAPYYSAGNNDKRQALNRWIRTGGQYDAVVDFDAAVRDPANGNALLAAYDSGDHLHPSDAGYQVMANTFDLGSIESLCVPK